MVAALSRKDLICKFRALGYAGLFRAENTNLWSREVKKSAFQIRMLMISVPVWSRKYFVRQAYHLKSGTTCSPHFPSKLFCFSFILDPFFFCKQHRSTAGQMFFILHFTLCILHSPLDTPHFPFYILHFPFCFLPLTCHLIPETSNLKQFFALPYALFSMRSAVV